MLARQYDEKLFTEILFCKDQNRTGRSRTTSHDPRYLRRSMFLVTSCSVFQKKKKKGNFPPTYPFCRTNPHTDQLSKGLA